MKIKHIRPTSKNYDQFAKLVLKDRSETSHKAVEGSIYLAFPRRVQHSEDYVRMFEVDPFCEKGTVQGEKVMESIAQVLPGIPFLRIRTCQRRVKKHAWSLICKLHSDPKADPQHPKVTANQVATNC